MLHPHQDGQHVSDQGDHADLVALIERYEPMFDAVKGKPEELVTRHPRRHRVCSGRRPDDGHLHRQRVSRCVPDLPPRSGNAADPLLGIQPPDRQPGAEAAGRAPGTRRNVEPSGRILSNPRGHQPEDGKESVPAPNADAGSIEKYGIELAIILAMDIEAVNQVELLQLPLVKGLIRTVSQGFAPVVRR